MTGAEIGLAGVATAGKKALELLVEDLYNNTKEASKKALKKWRAAREVGRLYTKISTVRQVKTLWQVDKSVDLSVFYCESHVYLDKKRKCIRKISEFDTPENLLIEGIAGQGKSIFLRYLCAVELSRGESFPIFLELRRIQPDQSLVQAVVMAFKQLGLDIDEEIFRDIASTGKVILFLDAFDEIHDDLKSRLTSEIEHLAVTIESLRIIVTSRPGGGLAMCAQFRVCGLSDLERDEYKKVIFKLLEDSALATQLIEQVEKHPGGLKELLKTPLMVTLLVLGYKSYQELPAQLSDFYNSLFQALLQRHDGVKPGYKRPRACRMNDFQYRQVFEAFCFYIKQTRSKKLDDSAVYSSAEKSLEETRIKEDAGKFLSDILSITCLLVKDGEEHRFIHKSVQEYYAAAFIARKPDIVIKDIYKKLFEARGRDMWTQELRFLSEIDPYRFNKYGFVPAFAKFLDVSESELPKLSFERVFLQTKKILDKCAFGFQQEGQKGGPGMFSAWKGWGVDDNLLHQLIALGHKAGELHLFEAESELLKVAKPELETVKGAMKTLARLKIEVIIKYGFLTQEVEDAAKALATTYFKKLTKAYEFVLLEEKQENILKLLG